jgi:hypothetical protein
MQEGDSSERLHSAIFEKTISIIAAAERTSSLGEQNYFESDGSALQE